jgi:hypothetical protein
MGLLSGQETILENGERLADEVHYKKLFFTYIEAYVPILSVINTKCINDWSARACHIELDDITMKYLLDNNAIKFSKTHAFYSNWNTMTESRYDKRKAVPVALYYISEVCLDEYAEWYEGLKRSAGSQENFFDIINRNRAELKEHMINYYKDYKEYGVA